MSEESAGPPYARPDDPNTTEGPGPKSGAFLAILTPGAVPGFRLRRCCAVCHFPYGGPQRAYAASAPGRYDFDALGLTATQLVEVGASLRVGASG